MTKYEQSQLSNAVQIDSKQKKMKNLISDVNAEKSRRRESFSREVRIFNVICRRKFKSVLLHIEDFLSFLQKCAQLIVQWV